MQAVSAEFSGCAEKFYCLLLFWREKSLNFENSGVRSCRSSGDEYLLESTASRVEIVVAWRLIYHDPQTGKLPSHSATSELLQLLNSSFARLFKSFLTRDERLD